MMIDAREPQILEWPFAKGVEQPFARGGRVDLAARYLIEQILELFV